MQEWFQQMVGPEYASAVMWTVLALVALFVLLLLVRLARGMSGGTFVMGGRNRKTRLAVMDATAVDANRRLVLVRRDHVEHLLLIGGPTDLVVEQNIGPVAALRRGEPQRDEAPVQIAEAPRSEPTPQAPSRPAAERPAAALQVDRPAPQPSPAPRPAPQPAPPPAREAQPAPSLDFSPVQVAQARPVSTPQAPAPAPSVRIEPNLAAAAPAPVEQPAPPPQEPQLVSAYKVQRGANSDSGWMLQHEEPITPAGHADRPESRTPAARTNDIDEQSLEDEMNRLLDDLSTPRR